MRFISAEQCRPVVTHRLAFEAIKAALVATASPASTLFPVVIGHGSEPGTRFTVKSATQSVNVPLTGLKVGTYWPKNSEHGLPRHNSYILLLDDDTGALNAVLEGGQVNAFRTAAADAVAAHYLARPDASRLVLFGAGHQAKYEAEALLERFPITDVLIVNRDRQKAEALCHALAEKGVNAGVSDAETACRTADIIVTVTGSTTPLFQAEWVKPGTHIASMGSDARGKQELPPALFARARLFADLPEQSRTLGEFQHAPRVSEHDDESITAIGNVIIGNAFGRRGPEEITIFDSSGVALQDLFIAAAILNALDNAGA